MLWSFSSLNNLFFIIVIDTFEEKLTLWHIVKYDSIEWWSTDYFCLIIWYYTGSRTWSSQWVLLSDLDCGFHLTCITYSLQEHLFYRTLLVAVLVYRCLSTVWLIQQNCSISFLYLYHTSLLYNIFQVNIAEAFSEPCQESFEVWDFLWKQLTASKPLTPFWITILYVRYDSEFVSGLLFKNWYHYLFRNEYHWSIEFNQLLKVIFMF